MIVLLTLSESGAGCTSVDVAKSTQEFCIAVQALTIAQKYDLLKNHKQLPTQYLGGCNGSFQHIYGFQTPLDGLQQAGGWWCILCCLCY